MSSERNLLHPSYDIHLSPTDLDHTADVQLHAWGASLEEAFESVAVAMFNYMTDVSRVQINEEQTITLELEEADREKLLFVFLDDLLYHFLEEERLVCADVQIVAADWTKNKLTVKVRCNAPTHRLKLRSLYACLIYHYRLPSLHVPSHRRAARPLTPRSTRRALR